MTKAWCPRDGVHYDGLDAKDAYGRKNQPNTWGGGNKRKQVMPEKGKWWEIEKLLATRLSPKDTLRNYSLPSRSLSR